MKTDIGDILCQIQTIRVRNNENWMALVRLSFECAPERAKEIMRRIVECDEEITGACKRLVGRS